MDSNSLPPQPFSVNEPNQLPQTPPKNVKETVNWLIRLNLPPLPECPIQAATQGKEPKSPHYIDGKIVKPVQWKHWQTTMPPQETLDTWFQDKRMGIGTLGGWNGKHWLCWIDIDQKTFSSQQECDRTTQEWEEKYKFFLELAPLFVTPNGGSRYLVAFSEKPEEFGANNGFSFSPAGDIHSGELLLDKGHTLLPPTVGLNQKPYEWKRWYEYPPVVSSPEDIGLYPYKKPAEKTNTQTPCASSGSGSSSGNGSKDTSITDFLMNEVYPRLSLEQAFNWEGHQFVEKEGGNKLQGNCPWHDSNSGTAFYCRVVNGIPMYRCPIDGGGTVIEYRYRRERGGTGKPRGKDFVEIAKELATDAGVLSRFPSKASNQKRDKDGNNTTSSKQENTGAKNLKPTVITIEPATDIPLSKPLTNKPPKGIPGDAKETIYSYSDSQWVVGYQYGEEGGEEIEFRQFNRLPDNSIETSKGNKPWFGYRLSEALSAAKQGKQEEDLPILLLAHNEKQVELARGKGIPAFTFAGRLWVKDEVRSELLRAKKELGEVAVSWISTAEKHTSEEDKKLALVGKICKELGISLVVLDAENDLGLNTAEEVLSEVELLKNALEDEASESSQNSTESNDSNKSGKSGNERKNNFQPYDQYDPDSLLAPYCLKLDLDPKNCVTYSTYESWMYNQQFGKGKEWITIDSSYYKLCDKYKIWEHKDDNQVLQLIAQSGAKAYKMKLTDEFGWVATRPYESNSHKEAAFKYNRNRLEIPGDYLSQNLHLLAFNNCVVDLRTGEKLAHNKDYYLTHRCPYDYEPNKPCPEVFLKFVIETFGEKALKIIRAFTSMFLDPTAPFYRVPHLIGLSGGGKGTQLRFWGSLLGEGSSASGTSFADISTPEGRHQFLSGKRICLFPDMGGFTAGLKAFYELVDNGPLLGRALFNPTGYEKKWNMRFALASVDHLQVENSGDGWARRVHPIPVINRNVIPDPLLGQKLEAVKADVISWALAMDREERDAILTSPPAYEEAVIASLNAAIHGDSTRSFVDLCLRPTSEPSLISNALLHELYKSYCKIHNYAPLGMSKFVSHLKTVIPRNFFERSWSPTTNGKRERIPSHWEYIHIPPEIFKTIGLNCDNPDPRLQYNPEWICIKAECKEGGLAEFDDFWNRSQQEPDLTPPKTPNPSDSKGVQGVQGENSPPIEPGQAETRSGSDCPNCPSGQGESLAIKKGTEDKNSKKPNENSQPGNYKLQTPPGQPGHPGQSPPEPVPGVDPVDGQDGQGGQIPPNPVPIPQDFEYYLGELQKAIYSSWDAIIELTQDWTETLKKAVWAALSPEDRKAIERLKPESPPEPISDNEVKISVDIPIPLHAKVEIELLGKYWGKIGTVVEVPSNVRREPEKAQILIHARFVLKLPRTQQRSLAHHHIYV